MLIRQAQVAQEGGWLVLRAQVSSQGKETECFYSVPERFADFAIDLKEKPAMKAAAELRQMLHHRPMSLESEAYKKFELQKEKKANQLKRDFPRVRINNLGQ